MIATASKKLAAFIGCREALVTVAYQDGPHKSIGFGSNSPDLKPGDTITISDAFKRLKKDIQDREKYIASRLKVEVSQNQFDAILDLYYQNANKNKGTLNVLSVVNKLTPDQLRSTFDSISDRLNRNESLDLVSAEFLKYASNASGRVINGLLERRKKEVDMFWQNDYGDLSQILVFDGNPRIVKPYNMPFDYEHFA